MAVCPNCDAALELTATECGKCGALFGPDSHWKPLAQQERPTFRSRLRPVFYVYLWLSAAMATFLLVGGEAEWFAMFIGVVIAQPWWRPLIMLLGPEYRSYGYWPMGVSIALNALILGWVVFGRGSTTAPAPRIDWISLFYRCLALVAFFGPLLAVIATHSFAAGKSGSPVVNYVGLVLFGFPTALVHSAFIVSAVFLVARLMPAWISGLNVFGFVAWGALLGFVVGLARWSLARKIFILQPLSFYEVLFLAGPVSVCGALFLASAMKTLRSNYLLQPTGRERPAAE